MLLAVSALIFWAAARLACSRVIEERGAGGNGYFWQHFRAPDGKVFELVADPAHP